jgi:hypothetical protein
MAWIQGTEYFWVVLCKNRGVHNKYNLFSRHAIPLAETDEISPARKVGDFTVRCDDCGQEYTYNAEEVLRAELDPPESFTPHPLFRDSTPNAVATAGDSAHSSVSTPTTGKTTVLERIRSKVVPYLRFRHKETPLPRWRRPPQEK